MLRLFRWIICGTGGDKSANLDKWRPVFLFGRLVTDWNIYCEPGCKDQDSELCNHNKLLIDIDSDHIITGGYSDRILDLQIG